MKDELKMIWKLSFVTDKTIVEINEKSGPYITEDGRKGYGTQDITGELSLDELVSLRDFINDKIKERLK